jgi:hypothetical protein
MDVEFMYVFLARVSALICTFRRAAATKTNRRSFQDAGTFLLASVALILCLTPTLTTAQATLANADLSWNPSPTQIGSTTTATFGVADTLPGGGSDPDCPAGATFSGTLTVTTPHGNTSTFTVTNVPCGTTNLTAVYPTDFTPGTGAPSTNQLFKYNATWTGTTTADVGGMHPTFKVTDQFETYLCCPPPITTPEFGSSAILVAAIGLVLVAAMKKSKLLKP